MLQSIKSFLWIAPFIAFLLGYQLLRFVSHTETIEVPSILGMHIHDAIRILSADKLNVRILDEKIDPDVQEGIIISQAPTAGQKVKPHQSVFLVLTRKPPKLKAPSFYGLTLSQAQALAHTKGIEIHSSFVESNHPADTCFAQSFLAGQELPQKSITLYCSSGTTTNRIFPDLTGRTLEEVRFFLESQGITISITNPDAVLGGVKATSVVKEQRPLAGSIVDIAKSLSVQLTVT